MAETLAKRCVAAAQKGARKVEVMDWSQKNGKEIAAELEKLVPGLSCRYQGDFGWVAKWGQAQPVLAHRGVDSATFP
jgi:hypothetical protein